jgi:hypothetical protein
MPAHRPTEAAPDDRDAHFHKCRPWRRGGVPPEPGPHCGRWWPHSSAERCAGLPWVRCPRCWDARAGEQGE